MKWTGLVGCADEKWNAYRVFMGKPEGKNY
jgi:hypothetical protein